MRIFKIALMVAVLVLGWLVGWSNSASVSFQFLSWHLPSTPVFVIYFAFLISGLLLGVLLGRLVRKR